MRSASAAMSAERTVKGGGVHREWMQPECCFCDDAERAERSGEQLGQVVACDVLHYFAAGARDGAIGEHNVHAEHEVAEAAVAHTEQAGVVDAENAADCCLVGEEGIECDALVLFRKLRLHVRPSRACADGGGKVLPGVLAYAAQVCGGDRLVGDDCVAPYCLGVASARSGQCGLSRRLR